MSVEFFIEDLKYNGNLTLGQMVEIGQNISHYDGFAEYSHHKIKQYVSNSLHQNNAIFVLLIRLSNYFC